MPFTYIADSNPAVQGPADTFISPSAAIAHIFTTHGEYMNLPSGNTGLVQVLMRNSSGVPFTDSPIVSQFSLSGAEQIHLVGQIANGNPCVIQHVDNSGGTLIRTFNSGSEIYGAEEGALVLKGNNSQSASATLLSNSSGSTLTKWVTFDGGTTDHYGGIASGNATGVVTHCKFTRCKLAGHGPVRNTAVTFNHCTFNDNSYIRAAGAITNSLFVNMGDYTGSDGFVTGGDHNAFDVAKSALKYGAGVTPSAEDVNSIFSLNTATNLVADNEGGFDVTASSVLINADSTGTGVIGASSDILTSDPPASTGSTLTLDYNTSKDLDLATLVTDDNNSIDWGSLIIVQQPTNGTLTSNGSVVTLDYTGTGYDGSDTFSYRVSDTDGIASNTSTVTITVNALPSSAVLVEAGITRGQDFTLTMTAYNAGNHKGYVRVFLKDVGVDNKEYECTVLTNTNGQITCNAPLSLPNMSGAEILVKPINAF